MARKSFSIHSDFYKEISGLPAIERGELLLALINWASDKEIPVLDPVCSMLFRLMQQQIVRISTVNAGNGAKGGRPKQSEQSEETEESEETETKRKKPTVSVTDTITKTIKTISSEPPACADAPSSSSSGSKPEKGVHEAVITLPLNDSSEYPIFEEQVIQWADLYPAVNVIQQLRNMKGWLEANPTKRKTKKGISRFVNAWLTRIQDKGGDGRAPPPPKKEAQNADAGRDFGLGKKDDPYKDLMRSRQRS